MAKKSKPKCRFEPPKPGKITFEYTVLTHTSRPYLTLPRRPRKFTKKERIQQLSKDLAECRKMLWDKETEVSRLKNQDQLRAQWSLFGYKVQVWRPR